mmetsp:Transcript_17016/g.43710  ORF Transcript_17016/g.43710 Transcript_17016/m.43710 type:complete len:179 (+) Transcript_17016:87-623(+)
MAGNSVGELYRLALAAEVPDDAWASRLQWTTAYKGVPGLDDQFLHLSTAEQVVSTAALYFGGKTDVILLSFSVESMEEADLQIRWEDAAPPPGSTTRGGAFPHVYGGAIPYACLSSKPAILALDPDGKHIFPTLGQAAATTAALVASSFADKESADCVDRGMDDEDGYDGCAATGMYG